MIEGFTGAMSLTAAGLLKGEGISPNTELTTTIEQYNNHPIVVTLKQGLSSDNQNIKNSLELLPDFMTGSIPAGMVTQQGLPINSGLTLNSVSVSDLGSTILAQAGRLFSSVPKFLSIFQQALSFVSTSTEAKSSVSQLQKTNFSDLGFQYENYTDVVTGGVSNQFDTEYLPVLADEFGNMGTMFDTTELAKLDDPGVLINNLISQGLGDVGNLEARVKETGIDLYNVDEDDRVTLMEILRSIDGQDLEEIFETTGFEPHNPDNINSLADVFEIDNLFSADAVKAIDDGDLSDLSRKLSNIGGNFDDAESLGKFYSSLELKEYPLLDELPSLMPENLTADLTTDFGTGTGENNTLTMSDMLGSITGEGYLDNFATINEILDTLAQDEDVEALLHAVSNSIEADIPTLVNLVLSKSTLQELLRIGTDSFVSAADRLRIEMDNLSTAGIDPDTVTESKENVLNFVGDFRGLTTSPTAMSFLKNLKTDDVYGQALEASLAEAHNLNNFLSVGIDPRTRLG